MVLTEEKVVELIKKGVDPKIEYARKIAKKLNMHITGRGAKEALELLDDYETNAQKALREKLLKTNSSLFSFILRPTDKIFTAKGGSINYNVSSNEIKEIKSKVTSIADGLDVKKYLKKVVKKQYVIDPNGVLFVDITPEGELETHIINTNKILWYENKGNDVKAIIFEPYTKEFTKQEEFIFDSMLPEVVKLIKGRLHYRVIDENSDRIYIKEGDKIYIEPGSDIKNYFGFVPAKILGDEKNPNYNVFDSIVQDIVDDADEFLRDMSVKTVHKLSHAYPLYYALEQACTRCGGEGTVKFDTKNESGDPIIGEETCNSCGGTGEKTRINPSDKLILKQPQEGDPVLNKDNIAGTISPNLETAKFYEDSIDKQRQVMFQAVWGTSYEQGGKRETATGRWIDAAPVRDRLRDISDTFSKLHKFLLDCYGKVILKSPKYESYVSYGDRYILENPDDLLKKYQEATNYNVSELVILDLRNQYFEAEYQNDALELMKFKKLSKIEPFPTMKVFDVISSEFISEKDKKRKAYYSDWVSNLTNENIVLLSEEELKKNFNDYIALIEVNKNNLIN